MCQLFFKDAEKSTLSWRWSDSSTKKRFWIRFWTCSGKRAGRRRQWPILPMRPTCSVVRCTTRLRAQLDDLDEVITNALSKERIRTQLRTSATQAAQVIVAFTRGLAVIERVYHEWDRLHAVADSLVALLLSPATFGREAARARDSIARLLVDAVLHDGAVIVLVGNGMRRCQRLAQISGGGIERFAPKNFPKFPNRHSILKEASAMLMTGNGNLLEGP